MKAISIVIGLLAGTACKGAELSDGRPSPNARIDAAADWTCSFPPAEATRPSGHSASVVFDTVLPTRLGGSGAVSSFVRDQEIVVFGTDSIHTHLLDGLEVRVDLLPTDPRITIDDVAEGVNEFGLIATFQSATGYETHFCILLKGSPFDVSRCFDLLIPYAPSVPRIVHDGVNYRVYYIRSGVAHRWTFDSAASLVGQSDLWNTDGLDLSVRSAAVYDTVELLVTDGWAPAVEAQPQCATMREHVLQSGGHSVRSVIPPDLSLSGASIATNSTQTAILYGATCRDEGSCTSSSNARSGVLTVLQSDDYPEPVSVPAPPLAVDAFFDGDTLVALLLGGELSMVRYNLSGSIDVSRVAIPLGALQQGGELLDVHAPVRIALDDYAVVYETAGASGNEKRLVRFKLVSP